MQDAQLIEQQRRAEQQCMTIRYLAAAEPAAKYPMTPKFLTAIATTRTDLFAAQSLQHPHVVAQKGMTRLLLGEDHFHAMNAERRLWIMENCSASVAYDQLASGAGQKYLFESYYDAFQFKMRFGTRASAGC